MRQEENKSYGVEIDRAIAMYKESIGRITTLGLGNELFGQRNESATKDAIRHFANGIGDPNPLWHDTEYAMRTKFGGIIAPPMFVNAIALAMAGVEIPGFDPFIAGGEWEWFKTIHVNDKVTVEDMPVDIKDKTRKDGTGPRQFLQTGNMTYRNQRDEIMCTCKRMTMSIEMRLKSSGDKISPSIPPGHALYTYSKEDLSAIDRAYAEEEIRGANTRYWESVSEGDLLKPVVKGPLTHGDMLAFIAGVGWMDEAHGLARALFRKYAPVTHTDSKTGITEWQFAGHFVDQIGREVGLLGANNLGIQTCCWLGHLVTNWMGDDGFLKKLAVQCRKIIYLGDTILCLGRVTKKYVENSDYLVECEIRAENRSGDIVAPGYAVVALPSRCL